MSRTLKVLIGSGVSFFAFVLLCFRPVPQLTETNAIKISFTVGKVFEAGEKDIVFLDKFSEKSFYINRGLENGLTIANLRDKLIDQKVEVTYPKQWTLLNISPSKHLSILEANGEVLYDERAHWSTKD